MYLHFEEWTHPATIQKLDEEGLPHANRFIKVFAGYEDPRQRLGRMGLRVVESSHVPLKDDKAFEYANRGAYSGHGLDAMITRLELPEVGQATIRALFRFSEVHGLVTAAMSREAGDRFYIRTPLGLVCGIEEAQEGEVSELHLDAFLPETIATLGEIIDLGDPRHLLDAMEGQAMRKAEQNAQSAVV